MGKLISYYPALLLIKADSKVWLVVGTIYHETKTKAIMRHIVKNLEKNDLYVFLAGLTLIAVYILLF